MSKRVDWLAVMAVAAAATLMGCPESWEATEDLYEVVWADDDSELAVTVSRYDKQATQLGVTGIKSDNHRHQLYVRAVAGGAMTAVTAEREGSPSGIVYMKSAGYFVLRTSHEHFDRVERVSLGGAATTILDVQHADCGINSLAVIPSPDAALVAVVRRVDCAAEMAEPPSPTGGGLDGTAEVQVQFLDATSLDLVGCQNSTDPVLQGIQRPAGGRATRPGTRSKIALP